MYPQLKRALRERNAFFRGSIPPWSACARAVFCGHLRFLWRVLMFLTILCVVLQLLSAVRQSWNKKTRRSDHQLNNPLLIEQRNAQSIMENFNSNQVAFRHFQWSNGKDEGSNQVSEHARKNLDTTPARRLASTSGRILTPHQPSHDYKGESVVDREFPKQPQDQILSHDHLPKRFPEPQSSGPRHDGKQTSSFLTSDRNGTCQPKNHVFFLKTHKTASSTILNILYRYGDTHNLTFALPVYMHSQLYYPHFFMSHFVEGMKSRRVTEFHIMCNHMRFRGPEVRKVMPLDTFYFSILRNPVSMMESLFTYYKSIPAFRNFKTLEDFLLDEGRSYNSTVLGNHYAHNILTFDFGFNNSAPSSEAELDERAVALISAVESEFHLILISEYFDESMVLLRHALCWTMDDVVSFRLNSRSEKTRKSLSVEMTEQVKKWSSLDWRLYQHFNASFWRRIDTSLGRTKLQEEVELLRARRAVLEKTCLSEGGAVDPAHVLDSSLKPFQYGQAVIQGYNIRPGLDNDTHRFCQRLIMPELQYTRALYVKQFPDIAVKIAAAKKQAAKKHPAPGKHVINANMNGTSAPVAEKRNSIIQSRTDSVRNKNVDKVRKANMPILVKDNMDVKDNTNSAEAKQHKT
ncbi:galactose-3-O-sulfotransferase 2 isoform X1 [Ictalurus punctatus]|uniref:Galactose-3-O-sulfotransferase 2 isoform X1 n=1 Tax=Ictalurus punctatus TaxID=7998 RepID=A0A2D0SWU3_ICTPU|nr:galactose-3-O-sulfotransferase 2 isoform X1 [Ictalurus punctatus]